MKLIKTDLRGLNALQVLTRARVIRNAMKDNPLFPSPTPTMAEFEAGIERLAESVRNTHMGGNRLDYALKQTRMDEMAVLIKSMAAYVSIVAQGNGDIMLAAGFEQRRPSAPISKLAAPQKVQARTSELPCTIKLRWQPVRGARMYRVFIARNYASNGPSERDILVSTSRCTIDGLDPLEYYTFRVQAIGVRTVGPVSDIATALSIGMKAA